MDSVVTCRQLIIGKKRGRVNPKDISRRVIEGSTLRYNRAAILAPKSVAIKNPMPIPR